ncbi:MAG: hypothetical protein ACKOPG_06120 [Novosphingobium sp.]
MSTDTVLSVMVLAVIALVLGAIAMWRRGGQRKQVWLMLLLAAIVAGNLAIWVLPDSSGQSLAGQAATAR